MNSEITDDQLTVWKVSLALRLRQLSGDAFQDFFADVMVAKHGEGYIPIRAHGALGDKGLDGYTTEDGCVHQCYGAHNGTLKVSTFTKKMTTDLGTAKLKLSPIMKSWAMVHNLDDLPTDVLLHFEQMKADNPDIKFKMFSRDSFEKTVFDLPLTAIEKLIGVAVALKGSRDLDVKALSELVTAIAAAADGLDPIVSEPKPVPVDKLEFNKVPMHWRRLIISHLDLAALVGSFFAEHRDPTIGEAVSTVLRTRYIELRQQTELTPGDILDRLNESVVSSSAGLQTPATMQAAFAILAYFFESCDIFEDSPEKVPA